MGRGGGGEVGLADAEEVLVERGDVGVLKVDVRLRNLLVLVLSLFGGGGKLSG